MHRVFRVLRAHSYPHMNELHANHDRQLIEPELQNCFAATCPSKGSAIDDLNMALEVSEAVSRGPYQFLTSPMAMVWKAHIAMGIHLLGELVVGHKGTSLWPICARIFNQSSLFYSWVLRSHLVSTSFQHLSPIFTLTRERLDLLKTCISSIERMIDRPIYRPLDIAVKKAKARIERCEDIMAKVDRHVKFDIPIDRNRFTRFVELHWNESTPHYSL